MVSRGTSGFGRWEMATKKLDYAELSKVRDEAKQLQIYKANAEMLLRTDTEEQRQTRERQQEK